MPSGISGNIIKTDSNKNFLFITQEAYPNSYIEFSSNLVKVDRNIEICGNITNTEFESIKSYISYLKNNINISGVSFESLSTDYATLADLNDLNNIINNLDNSFTLVTDFNLLETSFNLLETSVNLLETSVNVIETSVNVIETSVNVLETSFNVLETSFNVIETSVNVLETSFNLLETSFNLLETSFNLLETSVNVIETSVNVIEISVNVLETSVNVLETSVNVLETSFNLIETSLNVIDGSNITFNIRLNDLSNSISDNIILTNDISNNLNNKVNQLLLSQNITENSFNFYTLSSDLYTINDFNIGNLDICLNNLSVLNNVNIENILTVSGYNVYNSNDISGILSQYTKTNNLLSLLSGDFITRTQFDASFTNINTSVSGDFITREDLDASFANINISVNGDFVTTTEFDNSFNQLSNQIQNGSENFFFFFKLKPWSLVYNDGNYNYPINNLTQDFTYNIGTISGSYIDDFSTTSKNLQLIWKIPPRIFIDSTLSINDINYVPIYNNLIVEFKEQNETSWTELVNINNFPDPSNNSGYSNYNNKNDVNMSFIFNLTRNTSQANNSSSISIIDNCFNIIFSGGYNSFQNSKAYQFRIFLQNNSTINNTFDYKPDAYGYNSSNIYLYYPDISSDYYYTASRGLPKAPTDLTFTSINFNQVSINGELDSNTADVNNIIAIPIPSDDDDNKLIFSFDLLASKNNGYKKFIPYSLSNFNINNLSNSANPSINGSFSLTRSNNIEPEFVYDLSNYGMNFANDLSNISYASLPNVNIDSSFLTLAPLRNVVNSTFNKFITNYSFFSNTLANYNSSIDYRSAIWRTNNNIYNFNFFDNNSNNLIINKNNMNYKLYNSLNRNNINSINESRGNDLSNSNLSRFEMKSQKNNNGALSNIYSTFAVDTSFNDFLTTNINKSDISFTLNCISQDILPNGANTINDYSQKNGYYNGLILNDISYVIDLNDFFDESNDLCNNNIKLKTSLEQIFSNQTYTEEKEFLIYKITNDLIQDISLSSIDSSFNFTYVETIDSNATYFGLTSVRIHNSTILLEINGTLINLNKYLRNSSNNNLCAVNLYVVKNSSNNTNIKNSTITWPLNNNISENISVFENNYKPFSLSNYGTYEGNNVYNAHANITIYNNIFSNNATTSINNFTIGNNINVTNKYYWSLGRIGTSNNYFKDTNMLVFSNNPLNNTNHNSSGGTLYTPYNSTSYIKYNQALYQNNGAHLFYSGVNSNIYKDYSVYQNNNDSNLDYSVYDNSGDNINYNISLPFWFLNKSIDKTINNTYKWICFNIDLTNISITNDNVSLSLNNQSVDKIGTEFLFYIKLKYNGNLQINSNTINYSKWFDCLSILNPGLSDSQRVTTNLSGIYNNNISAGTYPLKLILPYLSSYCDELILLIGLYDLDINLNDINISFNQ